MSAPIEDHCNVCGAYLVRPVLHAKWHEELEATAAAARRAELFTKPVGPGASTMDSLRRGHNLPALPRQGTEPAPSPSPGAPE